MGLFTSFAFAFLLMLLTVPGLRAAGREECLSKQQQRVAIAGHEAVPLSAAMEAARERVPGEVLRARLCREEKGLTYLLTVLARDGKVIRVAIDAGNGKIAGGR
jgi:uncharacterized membrane protein YkoI